MSPLSGGAHSLRILNLGAVQQAPLVRIKRVAAMQRATIVPNDYVTEPPLLRPREFWLRYMRE